MKGRSGAGHEENILCLFLCELLSLGGETTNMHERKAATLTVQARPKMVVHDSIPMSDEATLSTNCMQCAVCKTPSYSDKSIVPSTRTMHSARMGCQENGP